MTYQELLAEFDKVYLLEDRGVLKVILAVVVAQSLDTQPVFMFIMAASSSGKTEMINVLQDYGSTMFMDATTSKTFISGQRSQGNESSLLLSFQNGLLVFKDFTTILSMNDMERGEIMGQLRVIYDGQYKKSFGTGHRIEWKGKISILAGITTARDENFSRYASLGERFISYHMVTGDKIKMTKRAMENQIIGGMKEKRERLKIITQDFLDKISRSNSLIVNEETRDMIAEFAYLTVTSRSYVQRSKGYQNQVEFAHETEVPTRFAESLVAIAIGLMCINQNGQLFDEDINILKKICMDSIPIPRAKILRELATVDKANVDYLSGKTGMSVISVKAQIDDLLALGMLHRYKDVNNKLFYMVKDEWAKTLRNVVTYRGGDGIIEPEISDSPQSFEDISSFF